MALRYLVLVGRRRAPVAVLSRKVAQRAALEIDLTRGRFAILTNASDAVLPLGHDRGAIVGTLFQKNARGPKVQAFEALRDPGASHDPVRTLHDRFWGAYLSVTLEGEAVIVTRDPSGMLPCLYLVTPDLIAFASDAALLEEAGLLSPAIAWSALGRLLYGNELPQQRTALSGLADLHAGTSAHVTDAGLSLSTVWWPWTFVQPAEVVTMEDMAARLEETVDQCIGSWASEHCQLVVAVSGGLDSSIVASSLVHDPRAALVGLTISTQDSRGDESAYAQALCSHLGLGLIVGRYEQAAADIGVSASVHLTRPAGRAPTLAYDAVVHREMDRLGADAFFTGSGGDNVFYSTQSARPLVDRYLAWGLHWGLVETARDISSLTGASLWSVLRFAGRVPRRAGPKYHWPSDERFLSEEQVSANRSLPLSHPWLDAPADALPAKASHIAMILRAQHYLDNYDRRLPFAAVHPLLSQPIVETMLAVPSWHAIKGGRDRAVARAAFSRRFPAIIADRRIKGGPDGFAAQLLRANLERARERLLDGALCGHDLLDRKALDAALTEAALARGHDYVRLLLLLDTEAWIEAWTRERAVSAGAGPIGRPRSGGADRSGSLP